MLDELFLDRVFAEPGDGAQPAGDGGAGPAAVFQITGEPFDAGPPHREQRYRAVSAPGGELAQVQCVRLPGQAAVPGEEPGQGETFGIGEDKTDRDELGRWDGGGHGVPPGGQAGTRKLGQLRDPSTHHIPAPEQEEPSHSTPPATPPAVHAVCGQEAPERRFRAASLRLRQV
jgi:hypothetical protein